MNSTTGSFEGGVLRLGSGFMAMSTQAPIPVTPKMTGGKMYFFMDFLGEPRLQGLSASQCD